MDHLRLLFEQKQYNAMLAWLLWLLLCGIVVLSFNRGDLAWGGLTVSAICLLLAPALITRSLQVMMPWELVAMTTLPIGIRGMTGVDGPFVSYIAIAAVALILLAELHVFGPLELTHWFAIVLVIMSTLAVAGVWAVLRYHLDQRVGTAYLTDNTTLMIEFGWAIVAGVVAGIVFDLYFRHRARQLRRQLQKESI